MKRIRMCDVRACDDNCVIVQDLRKRIKELESENEMIREEHNAQAICAETYAATMAQNSVLEQKIKELEAWVREAIGYIEDLMMGADDPDEVEAFIKKAQAKKGASNE